MQLKFEESFDVANYGGKHKLFKAGAIPVKMEFDDVPEANTESGKALVKMLTDEWEKQVQTIKKQKEKEYRDILAETEERLMKTAASKKSEWEKEGSQDDALKKIKVWLDEEVKGANIMIDRAIKLIPSVLKKLMDALWTKCVDAIEKKYKLKMNLKIAKAVVLIGVWSGIAVGTAAVATVVTAVGIAVTVVTHGAGAAVLVPAVISGSVATIGAMVKAVSTIVTQANNLWPTHRKAQARVFKATVALQAAVELNEKKAIEGKLGPKDLLTWTFQNSGAKRTELGDALKDLGEWTTKLAIEVHRNAEKASEMQDQVDKMTSASSELDEEGKKALSKDLDESKKSLTYWKSRIQSAEKVLNQYDVAIKEGESIIKDAENIKSSQMTVFANKVTALVKSDEITVLVAAGKAAMSAFVSLGKATEHLLKAVHV